MTPMERLDAIRSDVEAGTESTEDLDAILRFAQRVLEVHREANGHCAECVTGWKWPCPTVRIAQEELK